MVETPRRELSLLDSTCLIVGIIVGAGIYQITPDVAKGVGTWWGVPAIWILGGLLSLCGALGYAELASAYPREGGDYVYLGRAYGRWAGFLFGWIQLVIVRPGDIALMAFAFATYARKLYDPMGGSPQSTTGTECAYAVAAVVVLTAINIAGVREGKWVQNLLTAVKALGLLGIFVAAVVAPPSRLVEIAPAAPLPTSLALIYVLFAFGGWNEMAYVAAEVKDPRRNIVRALVVGTAGVTVLYLLVNGAFLYALGYEGLAASNAVAAEAVAGIFPRTGPRLISALICISALGAVNGLVFAGARISYAVGAEHRAFRPLGRWNPRTGTPARALLLQGAIAVILILALGSFADTILYTAAAVYGFYLATTLAVLVLRRREPHVDRPYRVLGYPVTPLVFCAACVFLIYSAAVYQPWHAAACVAVILLGLPLYWLGSRRGERPPG